MVAVVIVASCSTDDDDILISSSNIEQISSALNSGTWVITTFIDSGKNETDDFTGYNFGFGDNGKLIATNGSNTVNGTWSVTRDNSSNSNDIDFNIAFLSPDSFQELSEDWSIVSIGNNKIDLIHISGGNGGTDTLTFEKN